MVSVRQWRHFLGRKQNWLALLLIGLFIGVAIAAPWLAPQVDPDFPLDYKLIGRNYDRQPHPPNELNLLGTTPRRADVTLPGISTSQVNAPQVDVYHTLIWGTRSALRFGLTVTAVTATFGILMGLISGYAGGIVNSLIMRVTDAFLAFPVIAGVWLFDRALFTLSPVSFAPVQEPTAAQLLVERLALTPTTMALILFSWMAYARIMNTMVIQLKQSEYVQAAHAVGASGWRVMVYHLLPNAIAPVIVLAARDIGGMVILESAFTFVGLGGTVAWGVLLVGARDYIIGIGGNPFSFWWTFVPITLALILFSMGWNLLGDGLNDALNPRGRR